MITYELWLPSGDRQVRRVPYDGDSIREAMREVLHGGSGTFEWESEDGEVVVVAGFDESLGIIEVLRSGTAFHAVSGDGEEGVEITVGGQEIEVPRRTTLTHAEISEAMAKLPEAERLWKVLDLRESAA